MPWLRLLTCPMRTPFPVSPAPAVKIPCPTRNGGTSQAVAPNCVTRRAGTTAESSRMRGTLSRVMGAWTAAPERLTGLATGAGVRVGTGVRVTVGTVMGGPWAPAGSATSPPSGGGAPGSPGSPGPIRDRSGTGTSPSSAPAIASAAGVSPGSGSSAAAGEGAPSSPRAQEEPSKGTGVGWALKRPLGTAPMPMISRPPPPTMNSKLAKAAAKAAVSSRTSDSGSCPGATTA